MTARSRIPSRFLGAVLGLGTLAMTALPGIATAEEAGGACKGLAKDACDKAPTCSWVSSYTTKAGKTVEAFCRSKPTGKEGAAAAETAPAPKTPAAAPKAPAQASTPAAPAAAPKTAAPAASQAPATAAPKTSAPAATSPAPKATTPAAPAKDGGGKT